MTGRIELTNYPNKMHLKEGFFGGADIKKWGSVFVGEEEERNRGIKQDYI